MLRRKWGDGKVVIESLREIGKRVGVGRLFAEGTLRWPGKLERMPKIRSFRYGDWIFRPGMREAIQRPRN